MIEESQVKKEKELLEVEARELEQAKKNVEEMVRGKKIDDVLRA